MIAILTSAAVALLVSFIGTPLFIRFLTRRQYGQFIRQDGPEAHFTKRGTPTMGGVIIILATLVGYGVSVFLPGRAVTASGLLLLFLMVGLGFIGFLDDFTKISKERSLGLSPAGKMIGQAAIGIAFAVLVLQFPDERGLTPASAAIAVFRGLEVDLMATGAVLGVLLFVIWANFLITAWSNAVNLTDGLDGLAAGASIAVFGAYTFIGVWQVNHLCRWGDVPGCYEIRDPRDLACITAAIVGACVGLLWWNCNPAQIFMGDTGSLALGGALAGVSILSATEFLAVIIGGLFVLEVISDVIQIGVFKATRKRVFRMAPLHHHFELKGWGEVTIVTRFWTIAGLFAFVGLALFYASWVSYL